ncbi:MAG: hypothetical protein ABIP68_04625 [Ferruginibacter sp.]
MKFIGSIILIAALSFALGLYFPWWTIIIPAFIVPFIMHLKPGYSFLAGFLSIFFLWGILAAIISANNNHVLAHKASMLILKTDSPLLLIVLTALIGGVVAGLASLSSSLLIYNKHKH